MSATGYKYQDALLEIKGKIGIIKVSTHIAFLDSEGLTLLPHNGQPRRATTQAVYSLLWKITSLSNTLPLYVLKLILFLSSPAEPTQLS